MRLSIPGLAALESVPQIKRAIDSGDRHKVYRCIWWSRLLGRLRPAQRTVADELLDHPERFYKAIKRAPTQTTMNGIGAMIYTSKHTEEEGLFRGTHFLVVVFMPVLPLGSYLYAREGERYHFAGSLPFTTGMYLWRSLIGAGAAVAAAVLAAAGLHHLRYTELELVNGLDQEVHLSAGELSVSLAPGGHTHVPRVKRSLREVQVTGADGALLETIPVLFDRGFDVHVINPLGAAGVYRESIIYGRGTQDLKGKVEVFCGRSFLSTTADWRFIDPPETINMSSDASSTSRTLLSMDPSANCGEYLFYEGDFAAALPILTYFVDPSDVGAVDQLYSAMAAVEPPQSTKAYFDAFAERSPTTHVLRVRAIHYESMGLEEALRTEALAAHQADPTDPQALYLYLRGEDEATVLGALEQSRAAFAEEPYLVRLYVLHLTRARRYAEALELAEPLREDPALGLEMAYQHAELLMRLGREEQAMLALEAQAERNPAAAAALLRVDGTPRMALTENWRATLGNQAVQVAAGRALSEPYSSVEMLSWQLRNAPLEALELGQRVAAPRLRRLSPGDQLLLSRIALHQGQPELSARCMAELESTPEGQAALDALTGLSEGAQDSAEASPLLLVALLWGQDLTPAQRASYMDTLQHSDPFGLWADALPPDP